MEKKNNFILLNRWLVQTLINNPKILEESKTPAEIYAALYEIWLKEIQESIKHIIKELNLIK